MNVVVKQGLATLGAYRSVRAHTDGLSAALSPEDQCVQSMPDASPAKWHRAHTTWFFETFLLKPHLAGYQEFEPAFGFLFNSYYETVGARQARPARGLITRPSADEVGAYRGHVDEAMERLIAAGSAEIATLVRLGLHHEQQHQELLVTDMMHAFAQSPLAPAVTPGWSEPATSGHSSGFLAVEGGLVEIGHNGPDFSFDNETPRHQTFIAPFQIADRLVRNADWQAFMADGGYARPILWMSDGWECCRAGGWTSPFYWRELDGKWRQMGPGGLLPLDPSAPVRHVSWYEADAFARWAGARLPTEAEWELAAADPRMTETDDYAWQWTASAYRPYPGFITPEGAIGEYNGKFMINQMVLRGGSLATPPGHTRLTYRNFFHPDRRWQFSGVRLARDV